ncbi:MAG: hypothetical protein M2R45_03259 [Verrucomicrobia subdivision 3 bacterium]|nr:hypothetical protein [Limisphaerales bacterium]MCS1416120.1 hypothetical protein [Limisphaerales bacterium]
MALNVEVPSLRFNKGGTHGYPLLSSKKLHDWKIDLSANHIVEIVGKTIEADMPPEFRRLLYPCSHTFVVTPNHGRQSQPLGTLAIKAPDSPWKGLG